MNVPGWTAVIVNYNGAGYLDACLRALLATRPVPSDIIIVDNASTDDSLQELHAYPRVNVLAQPVNLGFAGGANVGLAAVETEIALLMNPDVEIDSDLRHPAAGGVCGRSTSGRSRDAATLSRL